MSEQPYRESKSREWFAAKLAGLRLPHHELPAEVMEDLERETEEQPQ